VKHVWRKVARCFAVERAALANAEAVLLVDDRQREPRERHRLLDQRMRADEQAELARGEAFEELPALSRRRRAGQEADRGPQPCRVSIGEQLRRDQSPDRREVLLRKRLRRCHQSRLHALLGDPQHRIQGDHGLARSDLSRQQPLHRLAATEVGVDRAQRSALIGCQLEPERVEPAAHRLARWSEELRSARQLSRSPPTDERKLKQAELLQGDPPPGDGHILERAREVGRRQGVGAARQPLACSKTGGQQLEGVPSSAPYLPGEIADSPRGKTLGRRIDRHQPSRVSSPAFISPAQQLVLEHAERGPAATAPLEPPAQQ
jgi:hypothetical protein